MTRGREIGREERRGWSKEKGKKRCKKETGTWGRDKSRDGKREGEQRVRKEERQRGDWYMEEGEGREGRRGRSKE